MHGVTLWQLPQECSYKENGEFKLDIDKDTVSNLYTWQDGRCDTSFLNCLPKSKSHLPAHTGYGCATLFWFAKNKPEKLEKYARCGTVQDLVVSLLCGSDEVKMSTQSAASWGYFLTEEKRWDTEALESDGFPLRLLPSEILTPGQPVGTLAHNWFGVPAGVTIGVALGDLQCSVYALLKEPTDAVMNISTSAQLAYVHPSFKPRVGSSSDKIEYFPYFDDKYLAVAASMNGGNTLATFVKSLQHWTLELGFSVPQSKVWEKLIALGNDDNTAISDMTIVPTLLGERYAPDQTASVTGITLDTLHLGNIFRALCSGIIRNMHNIMSKDELGTMGITRIVGNGSGLVRNPVLQKEVSHWYSLPLELGHTGDAALGAAFAVIRHNSH
ncbi:sedoheptulokinase-like isoform X2 [Phymastichus coffea]|nr:sedoheptulokinase-like isoform X2 [Phymastichus coffea]